MQLFASRKVIIWVDLLPGNSCKHYSRSHINMHQLSADYIIISKLLKTTCSAAIHLAAIFGKSSKFAGVQSIFISAPARARSGTVGDRYGIPALPWPTGKHTGALLALLFWEKSYRYALQAILWDLGNWSLMFASISGQNSTNLKGRRVGRQSCHTGTYFSPLPAWLQLLLLLVVFINDYIKCSHH